MKQEIPSAPRANEEAGCNMYYSGSETSATQIMTNSNSDIATTDDPGISGDLIHDAKDTGDPINLDTNDHESSGAPRKSIQHNDDHKEDEMVNQEQTGDTEKCKKSKEVPDQPKQVITCMKPDPGADTAAPCDQNQQRRESQKSILKNCEIAKQNSKISENPQMTVETDPRSRRESHKVQFAQHAEIGDAFPRNLGTRRKSEREIQMDNLPTQSRRQSSLSIFITSKFTFATQALASLIMVHIQLASGLAFGFSGATLLMLTSPQPDPGATTTTTAATPGFFLQPYQVPLFGSMVYLGAAAGICFTEQLLRSLGQRNLLIGVIPVSAAAWLIVYFAPFKWLFLVGFFILGITSALMFPATLTYMMDISQDDGRGRHSGIMHLATHSGVILPVLVGSSGINWQTLSLACFGITILSLGSILLLPQSPKWLVTKSRIAEAHSSLIFFRGGHLHPQIELISMIHEADNNPISSPYQQLKLLFKPQYGKMFGLLVLSTLLLGFSGGYTTTAYLVPILEDTHTSLSPYLCAVIVAVMGLLGIILFLCLMDRTGRKPLIFVSMTSATGISVAYGLSNMLLESHKIEGISWMPFLTILIFSTMIHMGESVFFTIYKELLPISGKPIGTQLLNMFLYLSAGVACWSYPIISQLLGQHNTFFVFGVGCALVALVTCTLLPESKNYHLNPPVPLEEEVISQKGHTNPAFESTQL